MKVNRVAIGIPKLDSLISGGFKKNSINLVAGGPGSGKTIFAIQFLVQGIKNNEPSIYITFEEKKKKLYNDMLSLGWNLEKYEKQKKFVFLEYTPEQVKNVLIEGGGTVDITISKMKIKRLVIDSITSFSLLYKEELAKKEAALALFELIGKWGCTALLTSQDTTPKDHTITAALEFEVDSIILLYYTKRRGRRVRAIEILKMRGTKHPGKTFGLNISNKGISINPNKIISF